MARVRHGRTTGKTLRSSGFEVPGIYQRIIEHERAEAQKPDPRWRFTEAARAGQPCPPEHQRGSRSLAALEDGRTVQLPGWCELAGTSTFPDLGPAIPRLTQKLSEARGRDSSIVGFMVQANDLVVPFRR